VAALSELSTCDAAAARVRLGWWLSSEEHDPRTLVENAVTAEATGFETAMISDHLQPWTRRQGQSGHVWTTIGAIGNATEALELGTGVTALLHRGHPINVAQAAATAAVLLDGRFFLGVGSGERLNEQPFGRRWPSPANDSSGCARASRLSSACCPESTSTTAANSGASRTSP
jgi:coenzyme F420-dependent glucose-6-phosphate dehydrogenase